MPAPGRTPFPCSASYFWSQCLAGQVILQTINPLDPIASQKSQCRKYGQWVLYIVNIPDVPNVGRVYANFSIWRASSLKWSKRSLCLSKLYFLKKNIINPLALVSAWISQCNVNGQYSGRAVHRPGPQTLMTGDKTLYLPFTCHSATRFHDMFILPQPSAKFSMVTQSSPATQPNFFMRHHSHPDAMD